MKYENIKSGRFISRPNRFIANVEVDGKVQVCHVKNTGRCRELLVPDARVVLEESSNPNRKTKFDLVSVYKGQRLINMDSQAPNKLLGE
ncbi:MAG: DNA/RNA nuclease SfsA, partial [Clostridia bacterium]